VYHLTFFQKLLSYFMPVSINKLKMADGSGLELSYFAGRWQLSTDDALYSDGKRYRPLRVAFKKLTTKLQEVKSVLLLGGGLGSAADILEHKGLRPAITIVEQNEQIIKWATELNNSKGYHHVHFICADAAAYVKVLNEKVDLLVVDVFNGRHVPAFATSTAFLKDCKNLMMPNAILVYNYIINSGNGLQSMQRNMSEVFEHNTIIDLGENRVFIASLSA
jgi:predicted membrane-bound spermidine synthase